MTARQAGVGAEAPARLEAIGMQHDDGVWRPGSAEHLPSPHVVSDNPIMGGQTTALGGCAHHPGDIPHPGEAHHLRGRVDLGEADGSPACPLGGGMRGGQQLLGRAAALLATRLHHGARGVGRPEAVA